MVRYAGKRLTAKKIAKVIDSIPHDVYVEPFAGLATVMKYKQPSKKEVVSDIDCKVIRIAKKENPALKRAEVSCGRDYKEVMKKYDSKDSLHYLDPPYEGAKKPKFDYKFNNVPLKEVLDVCKSVKGKCVLSHSPKARKEICSDGKMKCRTIPFNFWGHERKDLLAIKK
jgi:site-specific DNA-adenine methylase